LRNEIERFPNAGKSLNGSPEPPGFHRTLRVTKVMNFLYDFGATPFANL
jgi:hypothetical protein